MYPVWNQFPAALPIPALWCVLDIETGPAPTEAVERAIDAWEPPANYRKEEIITKAREAAETRIRERDALLDASPILCVACKTDREAVLFNALPQECSIPGWITMHGSNEAGMLTALRGWLDATVGEGTVLVGHAVKRFDLRRLRLRYALHRLRLPLALMPVNASVQPVEDTQELFRALFSLEQADNPFVSLRQVAEALALDCHKDEMDGSQVPGLYRAGRYAEICQYCAQDVQLTEHAWLLLTSRATELA